MWQENLEGSVAGKFSADEVRAAKRLVVKEYKVDGTVRAKVTDVKVREVRMVFKQYSEQERQGIVKALYGDDTEKVEIERRVLTDRAVKIVREVVPSFLSYADKDFSFECSCGVGGGKICRHGLSLFLYFMMDLRLNHFRVFQVRGLDILGEFNQKKPEQPKEQFSIYLPKLTDMFVPRRLEWSQEGNAAAYGARLKPMGQAKWGVFDAPNTNKVDRGDGTTDIVLNDEKGYGREDWRDIQMRDEYGGGLIAKSIDCWKEMEQQGEERTYSAYGGVNWGRLWKVFENDIDRLDKEEVRLEYHIDEDALKLINITSAGKKAIRMDQLLLVGIQEAKQEDIGDYLDDDEDGRDEDWDEEDYDDLGQIIRSVIQGRVGGPIRVKSHGVIVSAAVAAWRILIEMESAPRLFKGRKEDSCQAYWVPVLQHKWVRERIEELDRQLEGSNIVSIRRGGNWFGVERPGLFVVTMLMSEYMKSFSVVVQEDESELNSRRRMLNAMVTFFTGSGNKIKAQESTRELADLQKTQDSRKIENTSYKLLLSRKSYPFERFKTVGVKSLNRIEEWSRTVLAGRETEMEPRIVIRELPYTDKYLSMEVVIKKGGEIVSYERALDMAETTLEWRVLSRLRGVIVGVIPSMGAYFDTFRPVLTRVDTVFDMISDRSFAELCFQGAVVNLPSGLATPIEPESALWIDGRSGEDLDGMLSLDKILSFDWKVAIGDKVVSIEEFRRICKGTHLVKIGGRYVYSDARRLESLGNVVKDVQEKPKGVTLLRAAIGGRYGETRTVLSPRMLTLVERLRNEGDSKVPASLNGKLRPYQERGYSWMMKNARLGFGSILADDMGLGKTIQLITLLLALKENGKLAKGRAILIVPTGLLGNWQSELKRFGPSLEVGLYWGQNRELPGKGTDVVLTTYGVVRSDIKTLKEIYWEVIAIDEAQNIKNETSDQSIAVRSLKGDVRVALSGTPVENRLSEYWTIMDFTNHGYLGSLRSFNQEYVKPIQKERNKAIAELFRKVTAPFMMRRLKTDKNIIDDLPDKIESDDKIALTVEQAALYHKTVEEALMGIEAVKVKDHKDEFKRQALVLQMILKLKQICNHPSLYLHREKHKKEESGKMLQLMDMLGEIRDSGQKVLIFTQFVEMAKIISAEVEKEFGEAPLMLTGDMTPRQRGAVVKKFQEDEGSQIFILSLKAGGTGLNLTAASNVIHYDLWWNPAVEAQATDRAYRIGQHQNVQVHRFISSGTFEERIDQMIKSKKEIAEMTISTGEHWIGQLSNEELRELFA
ncbi:MAG: hypothetical protein II951_12285 [Bacteroidales bacterium]|nr:hypothetical protein [Bacteroidales bacterium]